GKPTTQTGQWQTREVHRSHIRPTQVKSYAIALALITPLHRPTSTFMRCQQPFHICTAQLAILEWIDTLRNVRWDRTPLGKIHLALLVYLRLGAPGLSLLLPRGGPCCLVHGLCTVRARLWRPCVLLHAPCLACQQQMKQEA